jgi:uroporphyrinogen decarboxylase
LKRHQIDQEMLNDEVPLIAAGSPWTIMCYTVEGKGSKSLILRKVTFLKLIAAHIAKITDTTIYI